MMEQAFLPIGSVVELINSDALVMIGGYLSIADINSDKVWDYSGFIYPYGYVEDDKIVSFDHSQIQTVVAYGYRDVESDYFVEQIAEARKELDSTDNETDSESEDE